MSSLKPRKLQGTPQFDAGALLKIVKSMPGCAAIPLGRYNDPKRSKRPLHKGWTKKPYKDSAKTIQWCIDNGHNIGIRLSPRVMVVDNDPRSWRTKGVDPLLTFSAKHGIDVDAGPKWKTGGGGYHKPYIIPEDQVGRFRNALEGEEYEGLEFKTGQGRMIVAPGSLHPSGKLYEVERDGKPQTAPRPLLKQTRKPDRGESADGGQHTPDQIAEALDHLDPADFDTNDTWFPLMEACHHASGGAARDEFIAWSTSDPNFANDGFAIGVRWDSLNANASGAVTYKTLNKALREAGKAEAQLPQGLDEVRADFEDDDLDLSGFPDVEGPPLADADAWMNEGVPADDAPGELAFDLSPYKPKDPTTIPRREWLYAPSYIRKFMGLTAATGGAGKSSLILVEAVAMACGMDLLGVTPVAPLTVFYWNGEDPQEELERRVEAILKHYKLKKTDLGGRLFIKSGRDMPIRIAEIREGATTIARPMTCAMVRAIRKHGFDVVIIDPFVSSHGVPENDNGAIEIVAKKWADMADMTNCAVMLSHHTRKTGGGPASIEDSRGASALNYAARTRRAINTMNAAEAKAAGIVEDGARLSYFKADTANSSMTKPAAANDWYRFESVNLMNGPRDDIGGPTPGDSVGVVVKWEYRKLALELSAEDARDAVSALEENGPWRASRQADKWAGYAIAEAAGVDATADAVKSQIAALITEWIADGTLEEYTAEDEHRKPKKCLRPSLTMDDFG